MRWLLTSVDAESGHGNKEKRFSWAKQRRVGTAWSKPGVTRIPACGVILPAPCKSILVVLCRRKLTKAGHVFRRAIAQPAIKLCRFF